ncbi:uncharacterized protein RSE6_12845 [Rhynchosporium secalis]|uniref:PHD-type domain-containing protein n=1 Tax=Rhynchosporium secalis TaxID=38038 RepID=A0A1E1MRE3_RHYSE|nr:uncharacterized protein RSE6_12845 [Rhynchosporium secalis]
MSANRPTRSRISSPFIPTPSIEVADSATEARSGDAMPKGAWTEPTLAAPRPSYAEAGHERHGVVLNMMPLGVGPSAKVLKALATVEKPKKSVSSVSTPEVATPESQQMPDIAEEIPDVAEIIETTEHSIPTQTIEEDEVLPKTPKSATSARKSPSRQSVGPQSAEKSGSALQKSPMSVVGAESVTDAHPWIRYSSDSATPEPSLGPDGLPVINQELTDKVVEHAVNEALDRHKWPTAYALRLMYDEARSDPRIVRLFDAVYNGWASKSQMDEFRRELKIKKKEGKKGRTGEYYFHGDEQAPPRRQFSNAMSVIRTPISTYQSVYQTPYNTVPQSSTARESSQPRIRGSMTVSASPQPDHEHISKKQRSNSFQPTNGTLIDGGASLNGTRKSQSRGAVSPAAEPRPEADTNGDSNASPGAQRSRSNSTSSSLSSVNEDLIENGLVLSPARPVPGQPAPQPISSVPNHLTTRYGPVLGLGFGPAQQQQTPRFVSPYASAEGFQAVALSAEAARHARPISQPAKAGPQKFTFSTAPASSLARPSSAASASNQPSSSSTLAALSVPNTTAEPAAVSSMAPTILAHASSTNSSTTSSKKHPPTFRIKNTSKAQQAQAQVQVTQEEVDASNRLKRKARDITGKTSSAESNERHEVKPVNTVAVVEEQGNQSDGADSIAVKPTKKKKNPPKVRLLNRNRETRQNSSRYASDEGSSPTELAFKAPFPPGDSLPSSRAGTPTTAANRPTRKQKTGSGLRVKTSPMKKKAGTSAGIPKDMRSPTSNGGPMTQDGDNDEFCSACGGNGDLLCCDGCTRSFHFKCVDPPMIEGSASLPDEWFCNSCLLGRNGRYDDENGGVWGPLIAAFENKNPRSFRLPEPIREYFEDVKTGADGEYEESVPPKPKNNKAGWEEAPDYFRKKDAKGKIILCHRCNGEASTPNRMIIPCSFCGLYWHLDCIDVPLAKEPGAGRQWRCPAHVDDLLAILPATLAPAHRFRKIKGASVIKPAVTRGLKNNGHIEIENDASEDEEEQGFYELREFGHVYKLPETSLKLDFISRVKQQRGKYVPSLHGSSHRRRHVPKHSAVSTVPTVPSIPKTDRPWDLRTIAEQQAALNLASLIASSDPAPGDKTGLLINTLVAEAPLSVISMMSQGNVESVKKVKMSKLEKQGIQAFFNLLKEKLDNAESSSDEDGFAPDTPPVSTVEQSLLLEDATAAVDNSKFATVESVTEDEEMIL